MRSKDRGFDGINEGKFQIIFYGEEKHLLADKILKIHNRLFYM
jgi:hypothetical protein